MSLNDLFKFVLNSFDGEEAPQAEDACYLRITIINKGSKVEKQRLREIGVVQYSSTNQWQRHHIVNNLASSSMARNG